MNSIKGSVPIPDPTVLTTAALVLAIDNLKELLMHEITSGDALNAAKIDHNYLMDEERHKETREWLAELNTHRLESKADRDKTVEIALSAQKELFKQQHQCNEEATAKAEQSFSKQLESMTETFRQGREALSDRITALKERVDRGTGKEEQQSTTRSVHSWMIPFIFLAVISCLSLVLQVVRLVNHQ